MTLDWKGYESSYRERLRGRAFETRKMIHSSSDITTDVFGRASLLDAKEKVSILLVKDILRLINRKATCLLPLL